MGSTGGHRCMCGGCFKGAQVIALLTQQAGAAESLRPAFRACPNDFHKLKAGIEKGIISIYQVTGDSHDVTIAGEVIDDTYFLWAVVGRGLRPAIREISQVVKRAGLKTLAADTKFKGVVKLVEPLGATKESRDGWNILTLKVV